MLSTHKSPENGKLDLINADNTKLRMLMIYRLGKAYIDWARPI